MSNKTKTQTKTDRNYFGSYRQQVFVLVKVLV